MNQYNFKNLPTKNVVLRFLRDRGYGKNTEDFFQYESAKKELKNIWVQPVCGWVIDYLGV